MAGTQGAAEGVAGVRWPLGGWVLAGLIAALVIHGGVVVSTWGPTYWDFGDGNYMYISRRLTEGVTLYKDILAPQPPFHLMIGAGLSAMGDAWLGPERAYLAFRAYSLALRTLTAVVLFLLTMRIVGGWNGGAAGKGGGRLTREVEGSDAKGDVPVSSSFILHPSSFNLSPSVVALVAVVVWLWLPIGFWWQLGYQSEPTEILFLLLAVWGVWRMTPRSLVLAGLASAVAAHCNMTAVPYFLCNAIFLACRRPRRLPYYLAPFLGLYLAVAFAAEAATGGFFWDNVVFNQTGTFPRSDILARSHGPGYGLFDYVVEKVARMGDKILGLEGIVIAFAMAGIALWTRRGGDEGVEAGVDAGADGESLRLQRQRREYIAWTAIGHFLSLGFVAKGGTVDYIFTIGEPFVAIFAALMAVALWKWMGPAEGLRALRFGNTLPFLRVTAAALVVFLAFFSGGRFIGLCIEGLAAELSADRAKQVFYLIDHYSKPGDPLLTPPFYAVMTDRRVAAEYSENYIWSIKYMNERTDGVVEQGVKKAIELEGMLERKEIPLVLLDMSQTWRIAEIRGALETHYQKIEEEPYQTLNTQLTFWIPKGEPVTHLKGWRRVD